MTHTLYIATGEKVAIPVCGLQRVDLGRAEGDVDSMEAAEGFLRYSSRLEAAKYTANGIALTHPFMLARRYANELRYSMVNTSVLI